MKGLRIKTTILLLLLVFGVASANAILLSDQGTGVTQKSNGAPVTGDLTVQIWDSGIGGTLVYNYTFNNAIQNGSWDLMLGASPGPALNLSYGDTYYKDYLIEGEDACFTDNSGSTVGRLEFQSPLGTIDASYITGLGAVTNETDPIWMAEKSDYYNTSEVDALLGTVNFTVAGNESAFDGWDKNASDDFSGNYSDLTGAPVNVSYFANDAGYVTSLSGTLATLGCVGNEIAVYNGTSWTCEAKPASGSNLTINAINDLGNGSYEWQFSDGTNYTTANLTGAKGDTGPQGPKGNQGDDGFSVVVNVSTQAPGATCPEGGDRIDFYRDVNNDGIYTYLTDFPLLGTAYACDATDYTYSGIYLYNNGSDVIFLNESALNNTIDARDNVLNESQVDAYVSNNGYLTNESDPIWLSEKSNYYNTSQVDALIDSANMTIYGNETAFDGWDKNASDDFNGSYNALTGAPVNVSFFANDAGYLTSYNETDPIWLSEKANYYNTTQVDALINGINVTETDPIFTAWNYDWNNLTNVPLGFADGTDNDTTTASGITITDPKNRFNNDNVDFAIETIRNISDDLESSGWTSGGEITDNANGSVTVAAGTGYAKNPSGQLVYVEWDENTNVELQNGTNHITVDHLGNVERQTNRPGPNPIHLGHAYEDATNNTIILSEAWRGTSVDWYQTEYLMHGIGALVADGLLPTINADNVSITIGTGTVHTAQRDYITPQAQNYTEGYYINDTFDALGTVSTINYTHYNNKTAGTIEPIPSGKYAKHELVYDYINEQAYLIYGNQLFDTRTDAEEGSYPRVPKYFQSVTVPIAGIVVNTTPTLEESIIDIRPNLDRIFLSGTIGVIGGQTADHGSLSGLSDDDHPQYLLVDGTRPMTGNLDLANNDLTNANSITANTLTGSLDWTNLINVPTGFSDGIDNDTTYTAGLGLILSTTEFSLNTSYFDGWDKNASDDFSGNLSDLNINEDLNISGQNIVNAQNVSVNECIEGALGGYVCFNSTHTWIG